jgi:hypothetical protein
VNAHTPGPWQVIPNRIGAALTVYDKRERPIATTCSNTSPATMEMHRSGEVAANARLIAAAPELLEALIAAEKAIDDCLHYRSHLNFAAQDKARAAIKKATEA